MPHVRRFFFPVSDFMRGAHSAVAWTDARALRALDALAAQYPAPFRVTSAFRRWPDVRRASGLFFTLLGEQPALLRVCALESGLFAAVSPPFAGGDTVSVTASCAQEGLCGVNILLLQDALLGLGLYSGPLSGTLCHGTRSALKAIDKRLIECQNTS